MVSRDHNRSDSGSQTVCDCLFRLGSRRINPKIPGVLIATVLSIAAVAILDLTNEGISVVGSLPDGFPSLAFPSVAWDDMAPLSLAAVGIALVAFAGGILNSFHQFFPAESRNIIHKPATYFKQRLPAGDTQYIVRFI